MKRKIYFNYKNKYKGYSKKIIYSQELFILFFIIIRWIIIKDQN
jgi:hypothetical protein